MKTTWFLLGTATGAAATLAFGWSKKRTGCPPVKFDGSLIITRPSETLYFGETSGSWRDGAVPETKLDIKDTRKGDPA